MKKTRSARRMHKMLIAVAALTLVLGVAIGGTVAYLVATAGPVTNTFTVGDINITLDEADVDDTDKDNSTTDRDNTNTYHIVPGDTIQKDPTVTVSAKSEACYVFVCVDNQLLIDGQAKINDVPVAAPAINTEWTVVATSGTKTVYKYQAIVPYSENPTPLTAVFNTVKIADEITEDKLDQLKDKTIVIKAYAHQADNVEYNDAEAAALKHFGFTTGA